MASNEAYGRGSVAFEPGYNVGLIFGNCPLTAILTTSNTTSVPGDKTRSLPVTADTSTRNTRLNSEKYVPIHVKSMQLSIAFPRVDPVEVCHEQA